MVFDNFSNQLIILNENRILLFCSCGFGVWDRVCVVFFLLLLAGKAVSVLATMLLLFCRRRRDQCLKLFDFREDLIGYFR